MHLWLAFKFNKDPPFFYSHGGEHIASHNVVKNAFTSTVRDVGFHVLHEQTHVLLSPFFQSSCWRVDIVLSVEDIHILVDVVIAKPTQVNLISCVISSCKVVVTMVAHAKEGFYHNQHLVDAFLPLAIYVFGCLHQQANTFFLQCANMV
jgi:hypothetical protein